MPKISVIMLTYNREKFVARAIESVLKQDFKEFEYIIVDNGSTDNSGKIADEYAQRDNRIRVIHKEKGNIGSGRNSGLDVARGEYITFIDDDDVAYPDMLKFLYELVQTNGADVAVCGSEKEVENKILPNCIFKEVLIMDANEAVVELLKRKKYNAASPTKLWRKEIFNKIRFLDEGKYDDITVIYKLFSEAEKVVAHGTPKYCFFRHEGNNSDFTTNDKLLNPQQLDEYLHAFNERTYYLSGKLPKIAEYARYSEWSYMISMCNKIHSNNLENCNEQLNLIENELTTHFKEFYNSPYIQEFEQVWMEKYIHPILNGDNFIRNGGNVQLDINSICEFHEGARCILNNRLRLNANKMKNSKAEAYLKLHKDATIRINGPFDVYYNSSIEVFKNAELTLEGGYMNCNSVISCSKKITIGKGATIARGVKIYDSDAHDIVGGDGSILNNSQEVNIGEHVWIGVNAVVLKGVSIGSGAVIAAGAVVTEDVPAKCMAAGVPARVIKENIEWK